MAHLDLQTGTYAAAASLLGSRDSRNIGHNTRLHRYSGPADSTAIAVRYHATDIVEFTADGWLAINTGGWHTVTTWQRINALLPGVGWTGGWSVHSDRGTSYLYHAGHKITPYADGLSIHADTGAVGMGGAILLTADDVAAIESAAEAADAVRAEKRTARLLREHPYVTAPRSHRGYDHRAYDCERCGVESAIEREANKRRLAAEHAALGATLARNPDDAAPWSEAEYLAAGSHVTRTETREYPFILPPAIPKYAGERDYSAAPTLGVSVHIACPWNCPARHLGVTTY